MTSYYFRREGFGSRQCPGCGSFRSLHSFAIRDPTQRGPSMGYSTRRVCSDCRQLNVGTPRTWEAEEVLRPQQPAVLEPRPRPLHDNLLVAYLLAIPSFWIMICVTFVTIPYLFMGEFICQPDLGRLSNLQCVAAGFWQSAEEDKHFKTFDHPYIPWINAYTAFWSLFLFRYYRLIVSIFSYAVYKPSPISANPTHTSRDVTVLIPTVDVNDAFFNCIDSIIANTPARIIVITVGQVKRDTIDEAIEAKGYRARFPSVTIDVYHTDRANKRTQIDLAIPLIQTSLTSMADATVLWGPRFLTSALAPLEDPNTWLVGTNKRVLRARTGSLRDSFFNFIGCLYLERHNFDIRSQNALTGEVFVISGRTNIIRTHVIQDAGFREGYTNERFFFGLFGPIAADDDNYIVRWIVQRGKDIKFQYTDDARIDIAPIGEYPRFFAQCLRWVRTTWRSNPRALLIPNVWLRQPFSVYSIYIASFFNFALFFDALLIYIFCQTPHVTAAADNDWKTPVTRLLVWIMCSKMVKLITYFMREPRDLIFFPGYVLFAYYHSFLKLWAMFTFWDVSWGGRDLGAVEAEAAVPAR